MDTQRLKTFREVAKTLNFTRAAANLSYAQSSVTVQVKALEEELGTPLFDRLGKRVALTDAGRLFLGYAERIVELEEEARLAVSAGEEPAGTLNVVATETQCTYRLPEVLRRFRERYPRVRVVLRPSPVGSFCGDTVRGVFDGSVDLAFVLDEPVRAGGLRAETLVEEPLLVLTAPDHPLARVLSVNPPDLEGEPLLLTGSGCSYRNMFLRTLAKAGVYPSETLEFGNIEAIKRYAEAGMGIAALPAVTAEEEIAQGRLVALVWAVRDFRVVTQAVWHEDKRIPPAMTAFLDVTRELLVAPETDTTVELRVPFDERP